MKWIRSSRLLTGCLGMMLLVAMRVSAQIPSPPALLVLEKSDDTLAIVDPESLQVVARVPAGQDLHEVIASDDGKLAYISNYGGEGGTLNTISVVDLVARKALPPIDLGALHSAHGLAFAGVKLYFTAETNKVIGRYDPATQRVDWVLGTGQDRTHMIVVSKNLDQIVTSNVSSGTISIIEQITQQNRGFGPPPGGNGPPGLPPPGGRGGPGGGPRKTWVVTNVRAGNGAEGFDVSPDGKEIWVANAQDGTAQPGRRLGGHPGRARWRACLCRCQHEWQYRGRGFENLGSHRPSLRGEPARWSGLGGKEIARPKHA